MNDLVKNVTPLTRGIIWLVPDERDNSNPRYSEIDYLLDGLLTANLKASPEASSSRVIIGTNFSRPLYVLIAQKIVQSEIDSFITLLKDLNVENDILIVDQAKGLSKIQSQLAKLNSHLKIIE
jgi:hypothetical protein